MEYEKRLQRSLEVYFVLLLFSTMAYNLFQTNSNVMHLGYGAAFLIFFIAALQRKIYLSSTFLKWGGALLVTGFLSLAINNEHLLDSVRSFGLNINLFVPALYVIILGAVTIRKLSVESIENVLRFYSIISLIISIITVFLNFDQIRQIVSGSASAYSVALRGFFPNKNMFGDFAASGTVISAYYAGIQKKIRYVVVLIVQFAVTVLTLSRAALLFVFIFGLAFGFFIASKKSGKEFKFFRGLLFFLFICVLCLILLYFTNDAFQVLINNRVLRLDVGDAGRSGIQNNAIQLLREAGFLRWLFGYGPSGLNSLFNRDVHNTYLNLILTGGIARLLLFLLGIGFSFKVLWKSRDHVLSSFCLSCLISYLVFSLFETVVYFELGLFSFVILFLIMFIPLSVSYDDQHTQQEA